MDFVGHILLGSLFIALGGVFIGKACIVPTRPKVGEVKFELRRVRGDLAYGWDGVVVVCCGEKLTLPPPDDDYAFPVCRHCWTEYERGRDREAGMVIARARIDRLLKGAG